MRKHILNEAGSRCGGLLVVLMAIAIAGHGQMVNDVAFSNTYNPFKYTLSFANQAQMVHDGSTLVRKLSMPIADYGDLQFYRGHYANASSSYFNVLGMMYNRAGEDLIGFTNHGGIPKAPYTKFSDEDFRKFGGIASSAGILYHTRGKFNYAERVLQFALEARGKRYGRTSREYISSLHNVAALKKDLGQYEEAEKMFNYLVPAFKKLFGASSLAYAVVLNNKAMLLAELGRTKEALTLLQESLDVGKTTFTAEYIDYERVLTNRALLEQESGQLDQAAATYKEVMASMEKKEFEDHPDYNNVLVNYGSLLVQQGDRTVLAALTELSDKIRKRYGEKHPLSAKAVTNLAEFHLTGNAYDLALPLYTQVAAVQLVMLGDKHKDYLQTLMKIGICQWQLNQTSAAADQFRNAIGKYLFLLDELFPALSESEKSKFWASLRPNVDTYLAFILDKNQTQLYTEAYELRMKTKGLLINATNRTKATILESKDSVLTQVYSEWLSTKDLLATYYSSTLEDLAEDKVDLAKLEERANTLEKRLSTLSNRFSAVYDEKQTTLADVVGALKPTEVAVEIIRVSYSYGPKKGEVEYAAFIARKGKPAPDVVRLKEGPSMEKRFLTFYKNTIKARVADDKSYANFWQPVADAVAGASTVYVSVDGVYNSINLNTLQLPDRSYVIERSRIVVLPNVKSLVTTGLADKTTWDSHPALLVGSPDFGDAQVVTPLPGTKVEVEAIAELLKTKQITVQVLTGASATEASMKAVSDPSILHIATHGYFLSDVNLSSGMSMGVQVSRAKDNPLLRSGLLLSGAAATFSSEPSISGTNNGLLNAYEAMNLDLSDTRLVILSACETGTGEIVNGEGVYGLTRAFQVAGARHVVMSLWKVDDAATEQLMTTFYQEWLATNNMQQAFVTAQLVIKAKFPEPYFWGGFVLMN